MIRRFAAVVVAVAMLSGCDALLMPSPPDAECTLIGCNSQVRFELDVDLTVDETYEIEACLDDACQADTVGVRAGASGAAESLLVDVTTDTVVLLLPEGDYGGAHTVSLTLRGADLEPIEIRADTQFDRSQPNGVNCPPACWQAVVSA